MAYNKPPLDTLPFNFSGSGYTKPDLDALEFNFASQDAGSSIGYLKASIQAMTLEYDRTKVCPTYTVGYGRGHVQILKGPCTYEAARILRATITGYDKLSGQADLGGYIKQVDSGSADLSGYIKKIFKQDLPASIAVQLYKDLPANIAPIPPADLSAYLNPWPQRNLPATMYGWQYSDLNAYVNTLGAGYEDLSAYVNVIEIRDLPVIMRGWVSTYADLGGILHAFLVKELPAYIQGTEYLDLPTYIFGVRPRDLYATIHGWQELDLPASINGLNWPWNLTASITGTGNHRNLPAYIRIFKAVEVTSNLPASVHSWEYKQLTANIYGDNAGILWASIVPTGQSLDLSASIQPKMIKLTSVVKVATMEHNDLSATVNVCFGTGMKDLPAYLRVVYKRELSAYIKSLSVYTEKNLSAKIGYSGTQAIDKYNLSIILQPSAYWTEDKYALALRIYSNARSLSGYIKGTLRYTGLTASITAEDLPYYTFGGEPIKNREQVVWTDYAGVFKKYETVEMFFSEMVTDYYYSSSGDYVWEVEKAERWVLKLSSYIPANTALTIKRKLHKSLYLADLKRFSSIDAAMRYAIDMVTTYPQSNLSAAITAKGTYRALRATISPLYTVTDNSSLNGSINGIREII